MTLMPSSTPEQINSAMSGAEFAIKEYLSALEAGDLRSALDQLTAAKEAHRVIMQTCSKAATTMMANVTPETQKLTEGFVYYLSVIANTSDAHLSGKIN